MRFLEDHSMAKLAIIAARSQSKGLPNKNIKNFAGRPLLAHSVSIAKLSGCFDAIAFSSDDDRYLEIAEEAGATVIIKRPPELSSDTAAKLPVLHHALHEAEQVTSLSFDVIVDLQPTSPLRRQQDIVGAIETLEASNTLINVVSVCEAEDSPYYTLVEENVDDTIHLSKQPPGGQKARRQDIPAVWRLNGSIYAWRREGLLNASHALTEATGMWKMPDVCGLDIDTQLDFEVAAFVAKRAFGWPETDIE